MEVWKWSKYSSYEANHTTNKRQQQIKTKNKKQNTKQSKENNKLIPI